MFFSFFFNSLCWWATGGWIAAAGGPSPWFVRYFIRFLITISDNLLYVIFVLLFLLRTKKTKLPVFRGKAILLVFFSSRSRPLLPHGPATIEHFSGERGALSYDATDGDDRHFFFFLFICFSLSFSSCCCCCCMPWICCWLFTQWSSITITWFVTKQRTTKTAWRNSPVGRIFSFSFAQPWGLFFPLIRKEEDSYVRYCYVVLHFYDKSYLLTVSETTKTNQKRPGLGPHWTKN